MTLALRRGRRGLRAFESPRHFAWACLRLAVALAVVGLVGLVDPLLALPLAALLVTFAVVAWVVGTEAVVEDPIVEEPVVETAPPAAEPVPPPVPTTVTRTFRLPTSVGAEAAWLVGEFNGWSRTSHPMRRAGDWFTVDVELERGRSYRYRFLLDGERWENDWHADRYVENEFGTDDSVALL